MQEGPILKKSPTIARRGFTLIELGLVIAAVAILTSSTLVGTGMFRAAKLPKAVEAIETIHAALTHIKARRAGHLPQNLTKKQGLEFLQERQFSSRIGTEELRVADGFIVDGIQLTVDDQDFYSIWVEGEPELIRNVRQWYADDPRYITNSTHAGCDGSAQTDSPNQSDPFCFTYASANLERIHASTNDGNRSGGGGSGGPCTLCGELYRQKLLSETILRADLAHSAQYRGTPVQLGYWFLAKPVAKLMQQSTWITHLAAPFIRSWAEHMAHLEGALKHDNTLGNFIKRAGVPLTRAVGKLLIALNTDAAFKFKLWKIQTKYLSDAEIYTIDLQHLIHTRKAANMVPSTNVYGE